MSITTRLTRGTVLVNMPTVDMGTGKVFGLGELIGGLANLGAASINAPQQQAAIEAAERQAEADRLAKQQRTEQVIKFLSGLAILTAITLLLIYLIRKA